MKRNIFMNIYTIIHNIDEHINEYIYCLWLFYVLLLWNFYENVRVFIQCEILACFS